MIFFVILIIIACFLLGVIILVQNPKGGGLAGNVAGFSNQFMGVKQTTDVLEKGTWVLAIVVVLLCMFSALFVPHASVKEVPKINAPAANSAPAFPSSSPSNPK